MSGLFTFLKSDPSRVRTWNLQLRRLLLYPVELRGQQLRCKNTIDFIFIVFQAQSFFIFYKLSPCFAIKQTLLLIKKFRDEGVISFQSPGKL